MKRIALTIAILAFFADDLRAQARYMGKQSGDAVFVSLPMDKLSRSPDWDIRHAETLEPQESTNELLGTYRHRLVRTRTARVVRERNYSVALRTWFHLDDSAVADRNPEYVRGKIPKCQVAIANRFAINIPCLVPDFRWDLCQ